MEAGAPAAPSSLSQPPADWLRRYAYYAEFHTDYLDFDHTLLPIILHIFGVGTTIIVKLYYDLSPKVGTQYGPPSPVASRGWGEVQRRLDRALTMPAAHRCARPGALCAATP